MTRDYQCCVNSANRDRGEKRKKLRTDSKNPTGIVHTEALGNGALKQTQGEERGSTSQTR